VSAVTTAAVTEYGANVPSARRTPGHEQGGPDRVDSHAHDRQMERERHDRDRRKDGTGGVTRGGLGDDRHPASAPAALADRAPISTSIDVAARTTIR
jgi:hypothetical protein